MCLFLMPHYIVSITVTCNIVWNQGAWCLQHCSSFSSLLWLFGFFCDSIQILGFFHFCEKCCWNFDRDNIHWLYRSLWVVCIFFLILFFFFFFRLCSWHVEVPRSGMKLKQQQWKDQILNLSATRELCMGILTILILAIHYIGISFHLFVCSSVSFINIL